MGVADDEGRSLLEVCAATAICMLTELWAVATLTAMKQDEAVLKSVRVIASEEETSNTGDRASSALYNGLLVGGTFIVITLLLLVVHKLRFKRLMTVWLAACYLLIFTFLGWVILDLTCTAYQIPYDVVTCCCVLWNFGIVGVIVIYIAGHRRLKQGYLMVTAVILAWFIAKLPVWSTWVLLGLLTAYDVYSVAASSGVVNSLLRGGTAKDKGPAVHSAMPYETYRYEGDDDGSDGVEYSLPGYDEPLEVEMVDVGSVPPVRMQDEVGEEVEEEYAVHNAEPEVTEGLLFETTTHQLGLGDFTFYCLLTATSYRATGTFSSLLAAAGTLMGLLVTLGLVHHYDTPLPALPLPIMLGALCHFVSTYYLQYIMFFQGRALLLP
eukprot:TRINITY_DN1194_c0_g2_i3.p1 TRINITY_DN1194_c0_g2~~TRINITY_DN1194_c0_g2_i3.p1  ORF type:complete len:381 (+),score=122.84 TRINITY_DN1194_c0_g2_i3:2849-3991(+)